MLKILKWVIKGQINIIQVSLYNIRSSLGSFLFNGMRMCVQSKDVNLKL